jgi:selenocysteine lyase/cysteine desulfurase
MLNLPGIIGMHASMKLLLDVGVDAIQARLLELREAILERVRPLGYRLMLEGLDQSTPADASWKSAIVSLSHPDKDLEALYYALKNENIILSYRKNGEGTPFLRISPHFYNTVEEIDRVVELMR